MRGLFSPVFVIYPVQKKKKGKRKGLQDSLRRCSLNSLAEQLLPKKKKKEEEEEWPDQIGKVVGISLRAVS